MSYRSSPAFAIGGVKPEFRCLICGTDTATHHFREPRGICPDHCEDHEYERADRGGHACIHCDQDAPDDWYYSDDDVGFGSYSGYVSGEPIGTPASAMNGNAGVRNTSPEARAAWDSWVAFCERNGHP